MVFVSGLYPQSLRHVRPLCGPIERPRTFVIFVSFVVQETRRPLFPSFLCETASSIYSVPLAIALTIEFSRRCQCPFDKRGRRAVEAEQCDGVPARRAP